MIHGVDFNLQNVSAENMGHFMTKFSNGRSGISKGCALSYSGSTIYVGEGYIMSSGRLSQITGTESISIPEVTSGTDYCRLVYEVDLSKTNTRQSFAQGYFRILESYSAYPSLTQQSLDDHPTNGVYQVPFAKFTVTIDGIANWVDERPQFDLILSATLAAGQTQVVISDPSITSNSLISVYTSDWKAQPEDIVQSNGSLTMTFEAQASNLSIRVKVE